MATKQTGSKDKKPGAPAKAAPAKSAEKPAEGASKPEEPSTASTVLSALTDVVKEAAHQVAEAAENLTHKVAQRAGLEPAPGAPKGTAAKGAKGVAPKSTEGGKGPAGTVVPSAARKTHSFRRKLVGQVTSNKMNKTVVVEVSRSSLDRVYKKYVKHRTKYKAHDEHNAYKVGDRVEIQEHSPISREKRFTVVRLVSRPVLE